MKELLVMLASFLLVAAVVAFGVAMFYAEFREVFP